MSEWMTMVSLAPSLPLKPSRYLLPLGLYWKKCSRPECSLMASVYRCTELWGKYMKLTCSPLPLQSKQFMKLEWHSLPINTDEKFPARNFQISWSRSCLATIQSQWEPGNVVGPVSTFQIPELNWSSQPSKSKGQAEFGSRAKVLFWMWQGQVVQNMATCISWGFSRYFRIPIVWREAFAEHFTGILHS